VSASFVVGEEVFNIFLMITIIHSATPPFQTMKRKLFTWKVIIIWDKNPNKFVMVLVHKVLPEITFRLWNFKHRVQELQHQPMMHPKIVLQKINIAKGY
jgi:hypothetical protein